MYQIQASNVQLQHSLHLEFGLWQNYTHDTCAWAIWSTFISSKEGYRDIFLQYVLVRWATFWQSRFDSFFSGSRKLNKCATTDRRRFYVWNSDVILNHMMLTLQVQIWQFSWRRLPYRLTFVISEVVSTLKTVGGKRIPCWSILNPLNCVSVLEKMAFSIGNGRYYKLFPGTDPPRRVLIKDLSEPGLLSMAFIQG